MHSTDLSYLCQIGQRQSSASKLPWSLEQGFVGDQLIGICIRSPDREIVGDQGMHYGLSKSYVDQVRSDIDFLLNSRQDLSALLLALSMACGYDQQKMEYLLEHARKQVLQTAGVVPKEAVFDDRSKD